MNLGAAFLCGLLYLSNHLFSCILMSHLDTFNGTLFQDKMLPWLNVQFLYQAILDGVEVFTGPLKTTFPCLSVVS